MAQMILFKGKPYRINPDNRKQIQISHSNGHSWFTKFFGRTTVGEIKDLEVQDDYIIVLAEKGIFKTDASVSNLIRNNL